MKHAVQRHQLVARAVWLPIKRRIYFASKSRRCGILDAISPSRLSHEVDGKAYRPVRRPDDPVAVLG